VAPTAAGNVKVYNNRIISTYGGAIFLGGIAIGIGNSIDIYRNTFDSRTAVGNAGGLLSPYVVIREGQAGVLVHSNTFCSRKGTAANLQSMFPNNTFVRDCNSPQSPGAPQHLQVR
jgi:hypothetical protein